MTRLIPALLAVAACSSEPAVTVCDVGVTTAEVRAANRKIIGAGAHYPADGTLRGREDELRRDRRARRAVGWQIAERALAPVALAELSAEIPAWQTWYGKDDLDRLFKHLYEDLGADGRRARRRFSEAALDDAFGWNVDAVDDLDNWPAERWQEYVAGLDDAEAIAGVGGTAPVGYSPSAARHLLASYPDILGCMTGGVPAPFVDSPGAATRRVLREPVSLARCGARSFGPYFVAGDERLRAVLEADAGGEVAVRGEGGAVCRAAAGAPCEAAGPGVFHVEVTAGGDALTGTVDIEYGEASPAWAPCLDGAFPLDAAVVKASWRRADFGLTLPTYDTASRDRPDDDWGPGDGEADPGPDAIYTQRTPGGATYRLAALHIMTKELDHWAWVTLWWSPDPESDEFGADRPASIGGVWRNYDMCVVTAFDDGAGDPSWCSNPYLELGPGNAASNCIGCHQHGLSGAAPADVVGDRLQHRNNFPADYSWAVDAGDHLGGMFANVVQYYDSFE